nr:uncharacterized protein K02A2.6-like [Onthophagus taurus]
MNKTKTEDVIEEMKKIFARFGIPKVVKSDNGPQYKNHHFVNFAKTYGFKHITSSPKYPKSNGLAERAVQTVKNISKKNEDIYLGLLAFKNTPLKCGVSPAQLFFARNLRDTLPRNEKSLIPNIPDHDLVYQKFEREREEQKKNYDRRHRAREMEEVQPNQRVYILDTKQYGTIESRHSKVILDQHRWTGHPKEQERCRRPKQRGSA